MMKIVFPVSRGRKGDKEMLTRAEQLEVMAWFKETKWSQLCSMSVYVNMAGLINVEILCKLPLE